MPRSIYNPENSSNDRLAFYDERLAELELELGIDTRRQFTPPRSANRLPDQDSRISDELLREYFAAFGHSVEDSAGTRQSSTPARSADSRTVAFRSGLPIMRTPTEYRRMPARSSRPSNLRIDTSMNRRRNVSAQEPRASRPTYLPTLTPQRDQVFEPRSRWESSGELVGTAGQRSEWLSRWECQTERSRRSFQTDADRDAEEEMRTHEEDLNGKPVELSYEAVMAIENGWL